MADYTMVPTFTLYDDRHGEAILKITEDGDGLGMVQLSVPGHPTARVVFPREVVEQVCVAMRRCALDIDARERRALARKDSLEGPLTIQEIEKHIREALGPEQETFILMNERDER